MDLNKVVISGRLSRDPELKHTRSGTAVCTFSMAINKKWKDRNSGEMREAVAFVEVEAWGKTAEFMSGGLSKGSGVLVEGELKQDTWEDKATGKQRSKLMVRANSFLHVAGLPASRTQKNAAPADRPADNEDENFETEENLPF